MANLCPCLALLCEQSAFEEANDEWHVSHENNNARPFGKEGATRSRGDSMKRMRLARAFHATSLSMISCHCCRSAAIIGKSGGMTFIRSISDSANVCAIHGRIFLAGSGVLLPLPEGEVHSRRAASGFYSHILAGEQECE